MTTHSKNYISVEQMKAAPIDELRELLFTFMVMGADLREDAESQEDFDDSCMEYVEDYLKTYK